ncbi:TraR/DksA family transcriptional regulator [Mannheimia haemolytica]|uniref:TraR/DksA family transcriptional regulator n=1 Tax=Mannheimia haemolytica TaxID=75985 RepID=UPI0001BCF7E0|nr:TraR/DksA family transcriptional regulator [Mannheimia haemolytica]EEY08695.1 hypothetical protein COI_2683 [Mannheimia haemolytica serotype A2 str. OVINE]EEY13324.1 hypothetical protein COK_0557 [Mannheimia haemolytica serotype A2 str. BOVINE]EPZ00557.1 hypothetical protein L278_00825 [Mannheimia haemolytica D35]MDW0617354.1 TraR/DksA family transcriptional regulator [Mannheimia haemolytica]MDW0723576.1 TraR/DksA family transcriptional regulator [Mannheimia haemolytica]
MSDDVDRLNEKQAQLLELQLAPHLTQQLSDGDIELIALNGRDCIDCGLPIPIQRLRAVPLTVRCISCQQDYEDSK